ncbi:MAG: phosphoribosylamine--glycine ligase [Armatimonadetes bacterium]|nr:phosphoribosylamine--glycine ligase [Armatimonadota bacterium]
MKVLVIGSGAREHALAWRISQEAEVFASPGNPGISDIAPCFELPLLDITSHVELARKLAVDLVVVGPEDPLIMGLGDALRSAGITVFGPSGKAAWLEGSKAFCKEILQKAEAPTAQYKSFTSVVEARAYIDSCEANGWHVVVKASGAALGKGVTVCNSSEEAYEAVEKAMVEKIFGPAGETVVIEERIDGREFSLLTICSGDTIRSLPVARDYKRAQDNDEGPNTGGMGSFSPVGSISDDLVKECEDRIVRPSLAAMRAEGKPFNGLLFSGIMVKDAKLYCLEFNVRFGDPETQSVMPRLGKGFLECLIASAKEEPLPEIEILQKNTVSVVVASGGYPGSYDNGKEIHLSPMPSDVLLFHAGTANRDGKLITNGGRVLTVTATADTREAARAKAYEGVQNVCFEGMQYRSDIALTDSI